MKKIVVLNGSPHKAGNTMALVNEVSKAMEDKEIELKTYNLNTMQIRPCQACFGCKKDGKCVIKDDMQQIYQDIDDADGIIFATPVYMMQMSAQTKLAFDRLFAYLKQDYSSFLSPNKKVLFAATFLGGNRSECENYFDLTCKGLNFLGFEEYKVLIAGGLREPKDLLKRPEVLSKAKEMGEWLSI